MVGPKLTELGHHSEPVNIRATLVCIRRRAHSRPAPTPQPSRCTNQGGSPVANQDLTSPRLALRGGVPLGRIRRPAENPDSYLCPALRGLPLSLLPESLRSAINWFMAFAACVAARSQGCAFTQVLDTNSRHVMRAQQHQPTSSSLSVASVGTNASRMRVAARRMFSPAAATAFVASSPEAQVAM